MNAAQVRAKARMAMKRREEDVEQEEIESGEINLIPYLDIVTNLMLFLLASVSAGFILGQINTTLPDYAPPDQVTPVNPATKPDEQPLGITVAVTKQNISLFSVSGLYGSLDRPQATIARLATPDASDPPTYDYAQLNTELYQIAQRWKGKPRALDTYEIILMVDGAIPYDTVIHVMDAVRRRIPPDAKPGFPLPEVNMPADQLQGDKRVPVEPFDPDKHYLFPDILFSNGLFLQ